ncbi:MAG: putative 2-aminoethylphosphonate ABC transporter ATP-binding protein [Rhodospirillales bacterium]|nr:putative 2-aminoethylphosphonate ABC transporter ATP-binding protein [Rhodospirillales bacterium]
MSESGAGGKTDRTAYLRIEDLTKKFGAFTALKDVTLEIYEGEFVCFLGPSGCGKTTLLRAIAGLDIQTSGRVEQAGKDISALPPSERDFGIVFQSYALFPNLTVTRNIAYGLENRKASRAEIAARVTELLDLVGLPDQGDKYPAQLSGGQQQRIALARAIATSPGLLLLDEPLSALDAKVRVHLRHEVKDLQQRIGVTTVMVTHDQEEALTMADRIVVMNQGVIEQIGTPLEIYRLPATSFVADFIGTMNFVPGTVSGTDRVRLAGVDLACESDGLAEGTAVTVAVRPEDIVVRSVQGGEENALEARIGEMEFLGSFYRADLVSEGLGEARLRADLSINLVRSQGINEGDPLSVLLPRERIRIYPGNAVHG